MKRKEVQINVRVPEDEAERFKKAAAHDGGHAEVLRRYIRGYLRRYFRPQRGSSR